MLIQELELGRILYGAALQVASDDEAGGLQLVHVLQNEDFHLLRPKGNVFGYRILLNRMGVAAGKRQIVEPMLGQGGSVGN